MRDEAEGQKERSRAEDERERWDGALARISELEKSETGSRWPLDDSAVDLISSDFMAPLLRGALLPGIERGDSVTHFWSRELGWEPVTGRTQDWPSGRPLLLFNATEVARGTRFVVGLPAIPPRLLLGDVSRSLADLGGDYEFSAPECVRASANFPWGFEIPAVPLAGDKSDQEAVELIDGGVGDNSGLDSLAILLTGLRRMAHPDSTGQGDAEATKVMESLRRRGIVILEIDSSAKARASGWLGRLFEVITAPLNAMSRASQVQSEMLKKNYISELGMALRAPGTETSPDAGANIHLITFQCTHDDDENVMTAWTLGPGDKAAVLARFLHEWPWKSQLLTRKFQELASARYQRDGLKAAIASKEKQQDPVGLAYLQNQAKDNEAVTAINLDADLLRADRQRRTAGVAAQRDSASIAMLAPVSLQAATSATTEGRGWVYLGNWLGDGKWQGKRAAFPDGVALDQLPRRTVETIGRMNVRRSLPAEDGTFPPIVESLDGGTPITIKDVKAWGSTGYLWAEISFRRDAGFGAKVRSSRGR
jgi:hypothetical protein